MRNRTLAIVAIVSLFCLSVAVPATAVGEITATGEADAPVEENVTTAQSGPQIGSLTDERVDLTINPRASTTTETVTKTIENTGDEPLELSVVSLNFVPSEISASITTEPETIPPGESAPFTIRVQATDSIEPGEYTFQASLDDRSGNRAEFIVTAAVSTPGAISVDEDTIDLGEIFVGESATAEFEVEEISNRADVSGLSASHNELSGASIDFPGIGTASFDGGDSTTQQVVIEIGESATRGERFQWDVVFSARNSGILETNEVSFTADALFPPFYEGVTVSQGAVVFDEPKATTEAFSEELSVEITNGGDVPMDVTDVEGTVPDQPEIDFEAQSLPREIPPRETETVTLEASIGSGVPAGVWDVNVDITAQEPSPVPGETTGTTDAETTLEIEHDQELSLEETFIDLGNIGVTEVGSGEVDVSERLGYLPINSITVEKLSGPDEDWLQIEQQPRELDAGETAPFAFVIDFDPEAQLYESYEWEFEFSTLSSGTETLRIEATPEPVALEATAAELEARTGALSGDTEFVASEMAQLLRELEQTFQQTEVDQDRGDIITLVSAASSTVVYLDSISDAQEALDEGDHERAQTSLTRASTAFNTLSLAVAEIDNPELRADSEAVRETANGLLGSLRTQQEEFLQDQLADEETTRLEEAQLQRELARLLELGGEQERAEELRADADETFETYSGLIDDASAELVAAREQQAELEDELLISVGGQELFWIGSLSSFQDRSETISATYDSAVEQFEAAGAGERAAVAAAERAEIEQAHDRALQLSLAIGAFVGVILAGFLLWEIRALYRYRIDTEQAVSGDFLLPWAETD